METSKIVIGLIIVIIIGTGIYFLTTPTEENLFDTTNEISADEIPPLPAMVNFYLDFPTGDLT